LASGQTRIRAAASFMRFSHRARFDRALRLLSPRPGDRILDYGAGTGEFLSQVAAREPEARLCGFEPKLGPEAAQRVDRVPSIEAIHDSIAPLEAFRPNKIACLEVLEHLREADQVVALANFRRLLVRSGRVVVSVPIEIGPPALFKNLARVITDRLHRGITLRNVMLCSLGLTRFVPRDDDEPYIPSHVGFDHRKLHRTIRDCGFSLERRYSPVPWLGPLFNSQIFYLIRPE